MTYFTNMLLDWSFHVGKLLLGQSPINVSDLLCPSSFMMRQINILNKLLLIMTLHLQGQESALLQSLLS